MKFDIRCIALIARTPVFAARLCLLLLCSQEKRANVPHTNNRKEN